MLQKMLKIVFICCFCLLLAIPIALTDFGGGSVSVTENRTLASFPSLEFNEKHTFSDFTTEFENYCGDNIGLRSQFNKIHTAFNYGVMNIPSDAVHVGKDGWCFVTRNQNVDIATGAHVIAEETMKKIADYQQAVSDHYRSLGKEYYLLLIPSKASVYPEFLAGGDFTVSETTVDRLTDYLTTHTDVNVINLKGTLTEHKSENQLYLKTDTHWNSYGSYIGYKAIMERLYRDGTIEKTVDFDPKLVPGKTVQGDLSDMIGSGALPPEEQLVYQWESSFQIDRSSEKYTRLNTVLDQIQANGRIEISRHEKKYTNDNPEANQKSLLLYGDSMYLTEHGQGTEYLAESFSNFQYVRVRTVSKAIDDTVDPDIVIFECYERLIESVLTKVPPYYLPTETADAEAVNALAELPAQIAKGFWIGRNGLCLACKEAVIENDTVTLNPDCSNYTFYGWAADFEQQSNLQNLYLLIDGKYVSCNYGLDSRDVSDYFEIPNLDHSRFSITFSADYLKENHITELTFIMISAKDGYKYEPVTYHLKY